MILANTHIDQAKVNTQMSKSEMPARIALFALPPALTLELAFAEIGLSYLRLIEAKLEIIKINLNVFEDDFSLALLEFQKKPCQDKLNQSKLSQNELGQSKAILLGNQPHGLLMLPALKAAQLKWHPHAILSGFQAVNIPSMDPKDKAFNSHSLEPQSLHQWQTLTPQEQVQQRQNDAMTRAIVQAKLSHRAEDIKKHCYTTLNSNEKMAHLYDIINQLSTRTHSQNGHSAFWFSVPFKSRVAALNFIHCAERLKKSSTETAPNLKASCLVLSQGSYLAPAKPLLHHQRLFFIITGDNTVQLQQALTRLHHNINDKHHHQADHIVSLMQQNLLDYLSKSGPLPSGQATPKTDLAIVLQAKSGSELKQEVISMLAALGNDIDSDGLTKLNQNNSQHKSHNKNQYKSPAGSVFFPQPLGPTGLTFVYPGVGTVYPNMLNELHRYFPSLYAQIEQDGNLAAMLQADKIYAANLDASNNSPIKISEINAKQPKNKHNLSGMSLAELAIAGVGSSYLLTQLLMDVFKIKPKLSLGYSMGEAAMWASLKVWKNPHTLINKTLTDPLFTSMISGELTTVKKAWQREANAEQRTPAQANHQPIRWNSFLVRAHADEITPLLPQYPHAYLAIIQGDTCIISGCETQCLALLKKLGKRGIPTHRVTAMHTAPAMDVHSDVAAFYHLALNEQGDNDLQAHFKEQAQGCADSAIRFISATQTLPLTWAPQGKAHPYAQTQAISSEKIAQTLADTFCQPMDFPALINKAKKHGATLFVEVGADRQNTTLIDKMPHDLTQSHALAINGKGGDTIGDLLKALAQLISHRVPVSIEPLLDSFQHNAPQLSPLSSDHIFNQGEANVFS